MSIGASSVIGLVEEGPATAARVELAVSRLRGGVRGEADTLGKLDALLTALGDALDAATGDLGGQLAAEAQARASGDTGVIGTLRASVRAEADTLFKVDALLSGLSAALSQEATDRAQGDAAVTTALRDGVRNEANTLSKIVFLIDTLTTVVASKATPADLTLAVTKIIGGSPEQLDTFGEVFARFQAGDTAFTALTNTLSQNVAALTDLIAQANTARANGDTQTLAAIRGGVDPAFDTLSEIATALGQEAGTRAQAIADLTAAIAAGDTATRNALRGGVDAAFDTLNKIAIALGQEITTRTQADANLAQAVTDGDTASVVTVRGGVADTFNTLAKIAAVLVLKADAALGNGRLPYDFPTMADAAAATIPAGQRVVRLAGASVAGIGAATYVESATAGPGPGKWQSSGPSARWFEPVNAGSLSLEQLSALAGNAAASLAAVQAAKSLTKLARLDLNLSGVTTADLDSYMNVALYGRGKIDLYRKYVSGDLHLNALPTMAGDLSPLEHCPNSCRNLNPREVLIGDSISSYQADTHARSSMLATVLERELRSQARASGRTLSFFNRALGGQTWATLSDKPTTPTDRVISWYPDRTRRWLDVVKDIQPTRVFISFGMNDLAGISATAVQAVVNEIRSWRFGTGADTYATDIVLLTNLVPRPYVGSRLPANGPWNTQATQEGADRAAGFVRTFAKRFGLGLLDMNRMCCRARDGFDPTEGAIRRVRDVATVANGGTGTRQAYGGACHFVLDPTKLATDGSTPISIRTGPGDADLLQIVKTAVADQYQIVVLSGDAGNQIGVAGPILVTIPPPSDQAFELVFEKTGNLGILYLAGLTFSGGYGETAPNIWSGDIVSRGGLYTPSVLCSAAGALSSISFDYMEPTVCRPTVDTTTLFGTGDNSIGTADFAGSGYNHPTTLVEAYIYAIVLRATRLYDGDPLRLLAGQPVRWSSAAGTPLGYLTVDTAGALTYTDSAGKASPVVGGAWTTYTPTYTATNGGTVTFTPQRTSYEVVGKTLRIGGQFQVTSTSAIAFLDVSLPAGLSLKHGCTGVAANLGNGTVASITGLQGQTALRMNGGAAFFGTTGGTFGFNATVEIA